MTLAEAAKLSEFIAQDSANTAWAFATVGLHTAVYGVGQSSRAVHWRVQRARPLKVSMDICDGCSI